MSATSEPEVRSIAASKQEALRALLNSLVPNGQMTLPDDADIDKLAENLDKLLASKGGLDAYTSIPRDDQGRPLNEEGLPIMEIIEPVTNELADHSSLVDVASPAVSVIGQAPLFPLPNWALSPAALAARRQERDRILDILEQEEEEMFAREAADASEPTKENKTVHSAVSTIPLRTLDQVVRTPKASGLPGLTSSPSPPFNLNSQRNSQLSNLDTATPLEIDATRKPKKQKSVSFADPPADPGDKSFTSEPELDWGDVIPVRIDPSRPDPNKNQVIMKELVVERPFTRSTVVPSRLIDSDDDDEAENEVEVEELNEAHDMPEDEDSETEVPKEALGRLEASDDDTDTEPRAAETVDIDDTDFDEAMLQREIALAYYARRNQIGTDVTSGPLLDSTATGGTSIRDNMEEDGADAGDVQPNTTRFRQSRLRGNPQALINSAVQFGRVVGGELVVDEIADKEVDASIDALTGGSSTSQEDMTERTIQLLRGGGTLSSDDSTCPGPQPTQQTPGRDVLPFISPGSRASVPNLTPPQIRPEQTSAAHKPKYNPVAPTHSNQGSSQKPTPTSTSHTPQPMIIESGFGFDPAFQVAPKPKPRVEKPIAPMTETVKERVPALAPSLGTVREKGMSRFTQSRSLGSRSKALQPSVLSAASTDVSSATMGRDVLERPASASGSKPVEPPKRISRFRAERAGWL